jgi:hypothetical protein
VTIDVLEQAEALGEIVQSDRRPEFGDHGLLGSGGDRCRGLSQSGEISSARPRYFCQTILGRPSIRRHSRA